MSDYAYHGCGSCGPRTDGCFVSCEMTQQACREKGVYSEECHSARMDCGRRCDNYRQQCETALCRPPSEVFATSDYQMGAKRALRSFAQKQNAPSAQPSARNYFKRRPPAYKAGPRLRRRVFRNQLTEPVVNDCDETPLWCDEPLCEEREPTPPCTPCLSPPPPRLPPSNCSSFGYEYAQAKKPGISSANDYSPSCFVPRPCRG